MGLMTSPNMMTTKISHAILLVAFVFLGCGIPSHGVDESRQSLTDTSTRKVFDITENGANANDENSANLKLMKVKNALIKGFKSKYFHFHVTECTNVTLDTMTITAASGNSPNTDGCHISDSDNVKVINSVIGTGYDCVSIGQGNNQIIVNNVTCGPGHGLSVGSLGKYKDEKSVTNVFITNSKLTGTTNGARIKTYAWPNVREANGIVFDNLTMEKVRNPIIVDQHYGEKKTGGFDLTDKNNLNSGQDSPYKLKDIKFKIIKSTATGETIMTFACSGTNPCEAVELDNIELTVGGGGVAEAGTVASNRPSGCWNAKLTTKGTIKPELPACQ